VDNLNYEAPVARLIVEQGIFQSAPFVLLDAGCSGGIDPLWRVFGHALVAHGFDPGVEECRRLQAAEQNPQVHYHPGLVGLPEDHEFLRRKAAAAPSPCSYWEIVFGRSSRKEHTQPRTGGSVQAAHPQAESAPAAPRETLPKIVLSEFVRQQRLTNVDFIKVDTDGADLEVLLSAEPFLEDLAVLGALVECQFQGEDDETSNTFHNIDRLMKRHGLMIFSMSVFPFSRAALPAPYLYPHYAQTTFGQPVFGDVAFLRDPLWPRIGKPVDLPVIKLLKLVCLYEFFRVPDCAAELILANRGRISEAIDPDRLLDLLTPPLGGRKVSYREYTQAAAQRPTGLLDRARGFVDEALEHSASTEIPGAVGPINALGKQSRIEAGDPIRLLTPPVAWNYAAELPLRIPDNFSGPIHVRVRARVVRGVCSFGVLNRDGKAFQHRRLIPSAGQEQTFFLEVADRSQAKCIVIENASADGQSAEVLLFKVSVHATGQTS
jgi:hypothetical protein